MRCVIEVETLAFAHNPGINTFVIYTGTGLYFPEIPEPYQAGACVDCALDRIPLTDDEIDNHHRRCFNDD